jgi:hypothetical protein
LINVGAQLQAAAGWPQLTLYSNVVGALFLIPALAWAATRFGPPGAAVVWLTLNLGYAFITIPIMHTRLLKHELLRWYTQDVALPLLGALSVGVLAAALMPANLPAFGTVLYMGASWFLMTIASISLAARVRQRVTLAIGRMREAYGV